MKTLIITALLLIPSIALAGHPHMSRNNYDLLMYNRSFDIGGAVRGSVNSYRFLNGQPMTGESTPNCGGGTYTPIVSPWQPRNRRRRAGSNLEMRIKRAEQKRQEKAERRARRRAERLDVKEQ